MIMIAESRLTAIIYLTKCQISLTELHWFWRDHYVFRLFIYYFMPVLIIPAMFTQTNTGW